jgi:iron complex outermembrane receptor protein
MNKWIPVALCGTLFTGVFAETTNTVDSTRIVVTATRNADNIRTVPANPTVITAQDIAEGHYTSVPEVLEKTAGVFFRNYTDNPSQAIIDMRGFGDNSHGRVLVLVDGRRLNEADMSALNWSSIPLNGIDRIEVISGPATVLYGDNAVGGVINIITAGGSEEPSASFNASAGSYEAYDQNATVSGQLGGLGYTVAADHQSGDGYRDHSRYDNVSFYTGLDIIPNEFFAGKVFFSVVDRQYQLPGALTETQTEDDRRQSDEDSDVRDTQYNVQFNTIFTPDEHNTFAFDFGYRRFDQFANLNREYGPWGTYYDSFKNTWTLEPHYTVTFPIGNAANETTVGMDWRDETIRVNRFGDHSRHEKSAKETVDQETMDFYLNDRLFLMDSKLIANAGGRAGQSRIKVKDRDLTGSELIYDEAKTRHENAFTVGLTALPLDTVKLYVKYDEFYRFPFTDEQANYYGYTTDSFMDIDPERGNNIELGGSFAPTEKSTITLTAYRMEMEDEIRYNPSTYLNENMPDTLHQGLDLTAHYTVNDLLQFRLIYNYTEAEFTKGSNDGKRIPWVPRDRFRAVIDITPLKKITLTAGATYTGKMYAINDNSNAGNSQGGYTLFDLMLTYNSTCKGIDWNAFAGVDNLFGKEYDLWQTSNASGTTINHYPAPEQTWKVGLGVKF